MKSLKEIASMQRNRVVFIYLISILLGAVIIGQAYFIVTVVDGVFLQDASFQMIWPALIGLIIVFILRAMVTYAHGRTGMKMAAKAKQDFRQSLVKQYVKNPVQASLKGQSGEKVSIMMDSVDEVDSYFSHFYPQKIQSMIVPIMILIAVYSQNVLSGLIMTVTAPFIPFAMAIIGMKTQKKSEEQMEKLAVFSGRFLDTLQGLATLKFFGRAKQQQREIQDSSLNYRDATMDVLKIAFVSSLLLEFISMLGIGLVAIEVGLRLLIYEQLTFFTAFFVLILAPEFYSSLKELGSAFHTGRGSMGAAKKVTAELEDHEQEMEWGSETLTVREEPPTVALDHVSFSYGEDRFTLKNIDATFSPYNQIAIVGRSGAGKTTLLNLLSGLAAPSEGDIKVNGQSLYSYKEKDWFDQLSYISQNPYLFAGTIAENVAIGARGEVSREEVEAACEKAGVAEMVERLEKGYDTPVGEAGRGLSGGEKQRVALARAFLKRPAIILFDEPTVGLDLKTEQILQASIHELAQSATMITVAHRLHTVMEADQILYLEAGELVAKGTHSELIEHVHDYREMVSTQRGGDAG
ncbi:thiol reductant ABC exporter subunit CydD [Texcoconibacillus texcoconensis]|uniref:ATP-binding cassette subfamily C protein CydD n=1 Tax=Texcoconibacillus texcoconensis TaxID=1095777 RepID=A0A840QMM2_9BACI|nr:thiol reductant ABC exporter subunit CydD [Texcoconibacillus texcoconensis]MBB5172580.1 ATP-binding cassette subfamily C protein CydD [Texcoconibacillus texcoconensis]